jgi:hypothetical protein
MVDDDCSARRGQPSAVVRPMPEEAPATMAIWFSSFMQAGNGIDAWFLPRNLRA